ncbi:flippase [Scandinavium goeteborgense]|uniref:flippase n=1 Tax=Scandinavium goeteborgense TaxID=1851514 RepID=UPI0021653FF8|nr:flippase [Scandinavium goeteborgense]MCS2154922.1 flippase [Scandinavium goeteborgense]
MKKNIFYLFIVQMSNYIFPLITLPYLVRNLGSTNFGYLMLAQALTQYFILTTDFGFNFSATKKISSAKNQEEINNIYTETLNAKLILTVACSMFLCLIIAFVPMFNVIALTCCVLFFGVIGNAFFPVYLFQGLEIMRNITWIILLGRSVMLVLIFYLVNGKDDINKAALSLSLALALPGIISLILVGKWKTAKYKGFSFLSGFDAIKNSTPLFISQIAITFYTTFNSILIGHVFDAKQVGIYSAADKLRGAVQSIFIPIQQVVFPRINKDARPINIKLKLYGGVFILFSLIVSLAVFFIGDKVVVLYFGDEYSESANLFKWMSVLIFIVSIAIVFSQWGLITLGKERLLTRIYIVGAILHCVYAPIVTNIYGLYGTLLSVIVTEFTLTLLMGYFLIKVLKEQKFKNEK